MWHRQFADGLFPVLLRHRSKMECGCSIIIDCTAPRVSVCEQEGLRVDGLCGLRRGVPARPAVPWDSRWSEVAVGELAMGGTDYWPSRFKHRSMWESGVDFNGENVAERLLLGPPPALSCTLPPTLHAPCTLPVQPRDIRPNGVFVVHDNFAAASWRWLCWAAVTSSRRDARRASCRNGDAARRPRIPCHGIPTRCCRCCRLARSTAWRC